MPFASIARPGVPRRGASRGFTDCLLQAGARLVNAVDVGTGVRARAGYESSGRTNIRHLGAAAGVPDLATIDASFISLALILPCVRRLLAEPFDLIALVKPQFEVGKGRSEARRRPRPRLHRAVLGASRFDRPISAAVSRDDISRCAARGNRGFLVHLGPTAATACA
jgi:23S rRNA (cytidine1920-2'-O)/16S rRNA (cytidine1409-2'-O)-methyltransferase